MEVCLFSIVPGGGSMLSARRSISPFRSNNNQYAIAQKIATTKDLKLKGVDRSGGQTLDRDPSSEQRN
jgi:hypothetical protein